MSRAESDSGQAGHDSEWVRARAPAKVNLQLAVRGRRDDGYHELETSMLALDLADEVRTRRNRRGGLRLALSGPQCSAEIPADARNLAWRSAAAVLEYGRRSCGLDPELGIDLELEKLIPSQAGLGGASADAAAALLASEKCLQVQLPKELARKVLGTLGSDCTFFLEAVDTGFAVCRGRGERVEPRSCNARHWRLALVTPQVTCSTAEVYERLEIPLSGTARTSSLRLEIGSDTVEAARAWLFNHLEDAATQANPELRTWREILDSSGAEHFRLSGSGSSFFGLYEDDETALLGLRRVLDAARECDLRLRGAWVCRPSGAGAQLLEPGSRSPASSSLSVT